MGSDSTDLEHQIEIPLQTSGVADCHHHIGVTLQDIITGNLLLTGTAGERVASRQIYKTVFLSPANTGTGGTFHCLSAPVPCMLMHTCQCVEHSAFTYIGITDQCYITEGNLPFLFFLQNYSPLDPYDRSMSQHTSIFNFFNKNKRSLFFSESQDSAPDEKSFWTSKGTHSNAGNFCVFNQT